MANDSPQDKGRAIQQAFEKGVTDPNRDMSGVINALQDAARGKPEDYLQAIRVANQLLDNDTNPAIKKFFANYDIEPSADNSVIHLKRGDGQKITMDSHAKVTNDKGTTLEPTTRTTNGDRVTKATDANGTTVEQTVKGDGSMAVEKYTDKQGNHWEIERTRQADKTLRPTKITLPDGSKLEFKWNPENGPNGGTLYPTHMTETDANGKVVRDIEMKTIEGTTKRNTANWDSKVGSPSNFYGTLDVDSHGNTTLTMRDPLIVTKINADGNWSRNGVDKGFKRIDEKGRRTK